MHFKALNIIQCACLHPQIFVDGKQSAQPRNKYTEHQHGTRHQHHHLGRNHLDQLRFVGHQPIGGSPQNGIGNDSRQYAYPEVTPQERTPDEAPTCPHQLHRMDKEPFGVNGQADCIVYQGKRDESQNDCQPQQHQTDIADVLIHRINQVFLIKHLLYIRILPDFLPGRYFQTQNGPHIEKSKLLIVKDSLIKVIA